jgi:plastocyanin
MPMRAWVAVSLLSMMFLAGCSGGGGGSDSDGGDAEVKEIAMHNQMYEPSTTTVTKGTILRFEAHDTTHTAQTSDGAYNSGDIAQGSQKDITMDKTGTFVFHCRFHSKMQLTVTVA